MRRRHGTAAFASTFIGSLVYLTSAWPTLECSGRAQAITAVAASFAGGASLAAAIAAWHASRNLAAAPVA